MPEILPELPEDPFTGGSFGYGVTEGDYVLYSAGFDMEDNGGAPMETSGDWRTRRGDWIIHGENPSWRRD